MNFQVQSLLRKKKIRYLLIGIPLFLLFWFSLPSRLFTKPYSTILLDKNGMLLQARIADDGQWRFKERGQVPEKFARAIICYEDKYFNYHPGIDPTAIARAVYLNVKHKSVVSGGSTISMQVIRLMRNKPRTLLEKITEMILAIRLELSYSKQEILTLYANHAPFGGNVVGLHTAAWRYFGRSPENLSWGEIATLAVLPNSPSLVRPDKNRSLLRNKRNRLLDKLEASGVLDATTCALAKNEPLPEKPLPLPDFAPNLLSSIQTGMYGRSEDPSIVKTTVDLFLQKSINELTELHFNRLRANGINNTAALVLDVETGNVLVYSGNVNHPELPETESFVDIIPSRRSPGSTLKPLLYAAALQEGLILPTSLLQDIPTQVSGFTPQNFDLQYDGAVHADEALARSLNIPAVKMLQQYRTERFYFLLKKLGLKSLNKGAGHYGLSLILGGGENTMWEISGVYSSLARILNHYGMNSGKYDPEDLHPPRVIQSAEKQQSARHLQNDFFVHAGAIYKTFDAMKEVVRPGEEALIQQFTATKKIAWKTGTSFGFRDGWAIGVTPKYLVCVWVGNADGEGRPGLTGISTAAPLMFDIFRLLKGNSWFSVPYDDLQKTVVCRQSGNLATPLCEPTDTVLSPLTKQSLPMCAYHQLIHLDKTGRFRVTAECESPSNMIHTSWFILPPSMEWYYKNRNASYKSLPPWKSNCTQNSGIVSMEMIYPKKNGSIFIPVELDGKLGKCIFEVAHRNRNCRIFWHLDEKFIGETREFHQKGLSPGPGKHILVLVDEFGERLELPFEIMPR